VLADVAEQLTEQLGPIVEDTGLAGDVHNCGHESDCSPACSREAVVFSPNSDDRLVSGNSSSFSQVSAPARLGFCLPLGQAL
jgi:hypothetical protein